MSTVDPGYSHRFPGWESIAYYSSLEVRSGSGSERITTLTFGRIVNGYSGYPSLIGTMTTPFCETRLVLRVVHVYHRVTRFNRSHNGL